MLTQRTVLDVSEKMFRHDTVMLYGPKQTFGLYKNSGGRVVCFTIPTEEARKPSGRKGNRTNGFRRIVRSIEEL